ncbi:MAG: hypothetical protein HY700_15610 [Gemmatimonadetes bacterium]|nr:hypothetical protein [Gemmatimonadota bacterium]
MTIQTHPRAERTLSAPWLLFKISEQVDRLKREPEWQQDDHNTITLMKTPGMTVVLTALKAGSVMHEHQASGPVTIHVISGKIGIDFVGECVEVCGGELVTVDPLVAHEVKALEESVVLLTVGQ